MTFIKVVISVALLSALACACGSSSSESSMDVGGSGLDITGEDVQADSPGDDTVSEDGATIDEDSLDTVGQDTVGQDTVGQDTVGQDTLEEDIPGEDTEEPDTGYTQEFLVDICQSFCDLKQACDLLGDEDLETCFQGCLLSADDADFIKNAGCIAKLWHEDDGEANCDNVGTCDNPLSPSDCDDFCGGAAGCGFMDGQMDEVFGTTIDECLLNCGGFATLSPGGNFQDVISCALAAMESCDIMSVLECIVGNYDEICSDLCGPEGAAEQCELYPDYWADMDACNEICDTWETGQVLAVQICVDMLADGSFGGDEGDTTPCLETAPDRCMDPPLELPEGSIEFCEELFVLCEGTEGFEMFSIPTLCGWFMVGFLNSAPPGVFHSDFSAATDCIKELEECDTEGISWAGCFMDIYEPAMDACLKLVPCIDELQIPVEDEITVDECAMHLTLTYGNEPAEMDAVFECIEAAEGCQAIFACMPEES